MRVLLAIIVALLAAAPAASGAPSIDDLRVDLSPVLGTPSKLLVTASDDAGPVQGVSVSFGDGEDAFAESACDTRRPRSDQESFEIGHFFASLAPRTVTVTVFSGPCGRPPQALTQSLLVTPLGTVPAPTPPGTLPGLPDLPVLGGGLARVSQASCDGADLLPGAQNLRRIARATRCLVNAVRSSQGLATLRHRRALRRAGNRHVDDMLARRYFAHVRAGGPDLYQRVRAAGYRVKVAGENLGAGTGQYATARQVVAQWLVSTGHRENLLEPAYRDMGLGLRKGFPLAGGSPSATYALELGRAKRR